MLTDAGSIELKYTLTDHVMKGSSRMKAKILAKIIYRMTNEELFAFVSATILEMARRSGESTDDILIGIKDLLTVMEMRKNAEH